jgi:hypothetical protein
MRKMTVCRNEGNPTAGREGKRLAEPKKNSCELKNVPWQKMMPEGLQHWGR